MILTISSTARSIVSLITKKSNACGAFGHVNFALGRAEPLLNLLLAVAPAVAQPLQQRRRIGRQDEDQQRVRVLKSHLQRALHVNFQQHIAAGGQMVQRRVLGRSIIVAIHLGVFEKSVVIQPP